METPKKTAPKLPESDDYEIEKTPLKEKSERFLDEEEDDFELPLDDNLDIDGINDLEDLDENDY